MAPRAEIETEEGFQRFYREYYVATVRAARLLSGSAHAAEDLTQEAFVRLYRNRVDVDRPPAMLRTILVNVCRSWHRSAQRNQLRMARHGPTELALSRFDRELDHSLQRLPYPQRAVVVLRYWLGLSEAEIAAHLGCRPGTVKSRHARALRALRTDLKGISS